MGRGRTGRSSSNVGDIARFYGALLGGKLLPRALLNRMQRLVRTDSVPLRGGLGIFRIELVCGYAWGHDGAMPGYLTQVLASKDGSHVVVMAANGDSRRVGSALAASATNAYCTS